MNDLADKIDAVDVKLTNHIKDEGDEVRDNTSAIKSLETRLKAIEDHLSRQKGFIAGALFVLTALSYVLVEGLRKIIGATN